MKLSSLYNLFPLALSATTTSAFSQKPIFPGTNTSPSVLEIPLLGFGTWNLSPADHNASHAVTHALRSGYRHIDCATAYRNQPDVGHGIKHGLKAAGLVREQIWVTSKLWNDHHEPDKVEDALNATLADLGVGYLDLWLMHWPVGSDGGTKEIKFVETWKAMEKLVSTSRVRNIGISNFSPSQLRALLGAASIKPYAHQMELHPYLPQSAWLQYHREQGIRVTAYSPLGNSNPTYHKDTLHAEKQGSPPPPPLLQHPTLERIAEDRGCTPATVALTWGITRGVSVIPKSQHRERIEENLRVCELEYEDVHALQRLGMRNLTRFNNPGGEWGVGLFEGLEDA